MSESKRGGARPGAGRPATGKTTEYITLTLPKELAQKIRIQAKERNMTLSAYCIESLDRFANMYDEGVAYVQFIKIWILRSYTFNASNGCKCIPGCICSRAKSE